jgi:anti-sigma regulatory factor (Ser/Thr protein kinase)
VPTLTLAATEDDVAAALDAAEAFCEEAGVGARVAARLGVVLDELLSNIVNYAYEPGAAGTMTLTLARAGDMIEGEIADDGRAFEETGATPDLDAALDERAIGGLGLHIVHQLTSRFERWRADGRNHVRFALTTAVPEDAS